MPEYLVTRVIVKRETFNVSADSPEDAQTRVNRLEVATTSATVETDVQITLAGQVKPKGRAKGTAVRGTRIPEDWQPDVAYAKGKGMTDAEITSQAERFRLYWANRPGAGGLKLDWNRTWYTWVLTFCERAGRTPPLNGNSASAAPMCDAQWMKALDLYWRNQRWHRDYGPEPGRPGCKVPMHLLPDGMRKRPSTPSPDHPSVSTPARLL